MPIKPNTPPIPLPEPPPEPTPDSNDGKPSPEETEKRDAEDTYSSIPPADKANEPNCGCDIITLDGNGGGDIKVSDIFTIKAGEGSGLWMDSAGNIVIKANTSIKLEVGNSCIEINKDKISLISTEISVDGAISTSIISGKSSVIVSPNDVDIFGDRRITTFTENMSIKGGEKIKLKGGKIDIN